jgi:peptidoglycan L-alanyl-D-glutamate endopeptidase CwlK
MTPDQAISMLGVKTYPHVFGKRSRAQLDGVMPGLVAVAELAIRLCPYDGTVIAGGGLRSQAEADTYAAQGTGIRNSRHLKQPDGWGHAIDLIVLVRGAVRWDADKDPEVMRAFREMARAVKTASAILEIPIRQGCDWNMNGTFGESKEWDWPHFEDPVYALQGRAEAEMRRFRKELGL